MNLKLRTLIDRIAFMPFAYQAAIQEPVRGTIAVRFKHGRYKRYLFVLADQETVVPVNIVEAPDDVSDEEFLAANDPETTRRMQQAIVDRVDEEGG